MQKSALFPSQKSSYYIISVKERSYGIKDRLTLCGILVSCRVLLVIFRDIGGKLRLLAVIYIIAELKRVIFKSVVIIAEFLKRI